MVESSAYPHNINTFAKINGKFNKTKLFVRLFLGPEDPPPVAEQLAELQDLGVFLEIRGYHNFAGGCNEWTTFNPSTDRWPCFHPWFTLGVAVDGRTTVCCADYSLGLKVGNVYDQSIEEIWQSESIKSIRNEHISNKFERWKVCKTCDTWQFHPDIFFKNQRKYK